MPLIDAGIAALYYIDSMRFGDIGLVISFCFLYNYGKDGIV